MVEYVVVITAVPEALSVIVWFGPPLIVYVTVAFGVPVKVIVAGVFGQTVWLLAMETVGKGTTVMVTVPVKGLTHEGVPAEATLTRAKVVVAEYVLVIVALPVALRTIV